MIGALAPLCSRVGAHAARRNGPPAAGASRTGCAPSTRRDAKPVDLCRAAVEAAPEGDRYPTAFSAIVALVRIGLSDAEIIQHVVEPYLARFDQRSRPDRHRAIMSGLRWARAADRS